MNKPPAFQLYAQDFLTGVMSLTMEERGIYITLLCKQWSLNDEKGIPKKRLGLIVGYEWDNLPEMVKEKFVDNTDYFYNQRLLNILIDQNSFREKQRLNGLKGGRPKTQTKPKKSSSMKIEDRRLKIEDRSLENEVEIYPTFEDFFNAYDYKKGNRKTLKTKWDKLNYEVKLKIMNYLPAYIESTPNKKYRKHPMTFLNQESWEDEITITNETTNKKTDYSRLKNLVESANI